MARKYHSKILELAELYGYQSVLEELLNYPSEQENKDFYETICKMWGIDEETMDIITSD